MVNKNLNENGKIFSNKFKNLKNYMFNDFDKNKSVKKNIFDKIDDMFKEKYDNLSNDFYNFLVEDNKDEIFEKCRKNICCSSY